ncbi:MAG: hypothetical protein WCR33_06405 [Bacilli bacterium]
MLSTGQSHDKGLGLSLYGDLIFGDWSTVGSISSAWDKIYHSGNLTKLSQLTNDSGFITSGANITGNAASASKVLLHGGNEVNIGGSLASGRLYVNYNDGGNFTEYGFYNGGTSLAKIYASTFFGELSGNASSSTNAGYLRVIASRTGSETWLPDDNSVDTQKLKVYDVYAQAGTPSTYGNVLEINGIANHWKPQLWFDGSSHNIRYRNRGYNATTWLPWKLIAFTDSNVESATKLETSRTI